MCNTEQNFIKYTQWFIVASQNTNFLFEFEIAVTRCQQDIQKKENQIRLLKQMWQLDGLHTFVIITGDKSCW